MGGGGGGVVVEEVKDINFRLWSEGRTSSECTWVSPGH